MSWPTVELQEVCRTGSGTTPSRKKTEFYSGNIPWVKSGELRETEIMDTEEHVSEEAVKSTSLKIVPPGSLLVAMYGATVGRVGLLGVQATTNQAVCHVIPDPEKADNRYLFHLLQERAQELIGRGVGGAQPNINQGTIKQLQIPLPPLDEQKRIAAILDQADALRRLRQNALAQLNTLGQAIFHEMFGAFFDDFGGWPVSRIDEVIDDAKIGLVRGSKDMSDEFPVPYLRMDSIESGGGLRLADLKRVNASEKELKDYSLKSGDFLFNTRNSRELVGKTAVLWEEFNGVYNNNILRCRFTSDMTGAFLDAFLRTNKGKRSLEGIKSGTTSVFAIYQKSFMGLPVPCPPRDLQDKFSERLKLIAAERKRLDLSLKSIGALFSSIQNRAFQGEL